MPEGETVTLTDEMRRIMDSNRPPPLNVHQAIHAVSCDLSKSGVGKDGYNQQQNFAFRGIDDVMNALSASMAKHGLFIVPCVEKSTMSEAGQTRNNKTMWRVVLEVSYSVYACDGSSLTARVIGEAMDMQDKATNKAMSVAFKYLCLQMFCIPTEGLMEEPDANSPSVDMAPRNTQTPPPVRQQPQKEKRKNPEPFKPMDPGKVQLIKNLAGEAGVTDEQILSEFPGSTIDNIHADFAEEIIGRLNSKLNRGEG